MTNTRTPREVPPIREDALAVSVAQACKALNIGKTRFYAEVREARIHTKKVGAKTLVPVSELAAWLDRLPAIDRMEAA